VIDLTRPEFTWFSTVY